MHDQCSSRSGLVACKSRNPPLLLMVASAVLRRTSGKDKVPHCPLLDAAHCSMAPKHTSKPGEAESRKRKAAQQDVEQDAGQEALQDSLAVQEAVKAAAGYQQPGPEGDDGDCMPDAPLQHSNKKLAKLQDQYNRRGVVYISRIPPHMVSPKAHMVRYGAAAHLLQVDIQLPECAEAPEAAAPLGAVRRA